MSDSRDTTRLHTIDALRGAAALSVAFFHITNGNPALMPNEPLQRLGSWGWLGVDVFFVISGFVIPFALDRGGYQWRDAGRFITKRVLRIDPPYLATIALALGLWWISERLPGFRGQPMRVELTTLALHLGYLTEIAGRPWVLPIFWTLALEFQFYLSMALLFPLLRHERAAWRALVIVGMAAGTLLVHTRAWVPAWGAWFALGTLAHLVRAGRLARAPFFAALAGGATIIAITATWQQGLVAGATALAIAFIELERPFLERLGLISYSLYLVHEPIGGRVVNFAVRHGGRSAWINAAVVVVGVAVSLAAAWVMYRSIERPSQQLASRIRYQRDERVRRDAA